MLNRQANERTPSSTHVLLPTATVSLRPIQQLLVAGLTNTWTPAVLAQCVSRHSFLTDADWQLAMSGTGSVAAKFRNLSRQTGLPQVVIQDIILGSMSIDIIPSKQPGSRILVTFAGLPSQPFFVTREDGSYKMAASKSSSSEVGTEALYLLHHGQQAEAASLLDWKRDLIEKGQGDDPLGGILFARLWPAIADSAPQSIELAAASLVSDKATLLSTLPAAIDARKRAKTDEQRNNFDLLIASIYLRAEDAGNAKLISQQLLNRHPDSPTAVALTGSAFRLAKDWPAWKSVLDTQLQKRPNDRSVLQQYAFEAESEGDFARARHSYQTILDSGHALPDDYNMDAWLSLFQASVDDQALAAAQQANLLTRNANYSYLHTLACLYAARADTAEARQLLLEAMSTGNMEVPDGDIWYGFGLIYEQYGVDDAATAAYQRVPPSPGATDPAGVFPLAQSRLKSLRANKTPQP